MGEHRYQHGEPIVVRFKQKRERNNVEMITIGWIEGESIMTVSGRRSLGAVAARIEREGPGWVVIRRDEEDRVGPYYYAFRPHELLELAGRRPDLHGRRIDEVLDLHEHMSSPSTAGYRPEAFDPSRSSSPSSMRAIHLDAEKRPVAIGEPRWAADAPSSEAAYPPAEGEEPLDVRPSAGRRTRGRKVRKPMTSSAKADPAAPVRDSENRVDGATVGTGAGGRVVRSPQRPARAGDPPGSAHPGTTDVSISAQVRSEVAVGGIELVEYRIDIESEAFPLETSMDGPVTVRTDQRIRVLISTNGSAIEALDQRIHEVEPPTPGNPCLGVFEIRALEPGPAEIALFFRQGGTQLGTIRLVLSVVAAKPGTAVASGWADLAPRDRSDDETLVLLIEQRTEGTSIHYEYRLHSEALGLNYLPLSSSPLLDRGGGSAATTQEYVKWIYGRVTEEVRNRDDSRRLTRGLRTIGLDMCEQLFDPDVTRRLWGARGKLKVVQITSWEPYLPWELLRLKDPETGDADDRFLCEYGLVRAMPGEAQPRDLRLDDWRYLAAEYPNGLEPALGSEVDYFATTLPASGITPRRIPATYDAFLDVLEGGEFDVLHVACHGESRHERIDDSWLIIGDEHGPDGTVRPVLVDDKTVRHDARLRKRQPIVFLNACESGRHGASLTAWGGWPTAFLKAGAGVFVGSSWPIREKPAAAFSRAFYDALRGGSTLADAATAARLATKDMGDGSWLAFKVYGNPRAKVRG